jgi:hypothetical protein
LKAIDYASSAAVAVDGRGRLVVAYTTIDHVVGYRLYARRFSADGVLDPRFGGLVTETGDPSSDVVVTRLTVDDDGRALALDGLASTLRRLTPDGRLDVSFGQGGVVELARVSVCKFAPARRRAACRER